MVDGAKSTVESIWKWEYKPATEVNAGVEELDKDFGDFLYREIYGDVLDPSQNEDELKPYLSQPNLSHDIMRKNGINGAIGWWKAIRLKPIQLTFKKRQTW